MHSLQWNDTKRILPSHTLNCNWQWPIQGWSLTFHNVSNFITFLVQILIIWHCCEGIEAEAVFLRWALGTFILAVFSLDFWTFQNSQCECALRQCINQYYTWAMQDESFTSRAIIAVQLWNIIIQKLKKSCVDLKKRYGWGWKPNT